MAEPGGIATERALSTAAANLRSIEGACLAAIDNKIARLHEGICDESAEQQCYALSNEVFGEAGVFGLSEISAIAHSLCSLLAARRRGASREALKIHVDAMRALRRPEIAASKTQRTAILCELRALASKLSMTETEAIPEEEDEDRAE
jgi:hypothetical protein